MFKQEIKIARELILKAGEQVMRRYGAVEVEKKDFDEPVTLADREANTLLVEGLSEAFPLDGILAEESKAKGSWWQQERIWFIDPIDGTKEFIAQNGEFAIMLGLAVGGEARLGLILMPAQDLLCVGGPGLGCEATRLSDGSSRSLQVSAHTEFSEMTMAISRSHRSSRVDAMAKALGVTREKTSGSVGVKLSMVARAEVDLYLHPSLGTKLWDACGPEAILRGAGGLMTDFHGETINYAREEIQNEAGLLASNGAAHARLVECLAPLVGEGGF